MNVRFYKYVTEVTLIKLKYYVGLLFITIHSFGFSCLCEGTSSMSSMETSTDVVEAESDAMTSNQ